MTYSELLHTVTFDEILPFIEKYHGHSESAAMYKMHYDMLRHIIPHQEKGDIKTATISNAELNYDWEKPHLHAYPMEGDLWEVSLAKELIVEPDVDASLAEIAACCLWHTSFYGFIKEQREEVAEKLDYYGRDLLDDDIEKDKAKRFVQIIENNGGEIPRRKEMLSIPSFRKCLNEKMRRHHQRRILMKEFRCSKPKRMKRVIITHEYRKRIVAAGSFITSCLDNVVENEGMSIKELCQLFRVNHITSYPDYQSFTDDPSQRALWLMELIDKYKAFNRGTYPNVMICVAASPEYPFTEKEHHLLQHIMEQCPGKKGYLVKKDGKLGKEIKLWVVFYE